MLLMKPFAMPQIVFAIDISGMYNYYDIIINRIAYIWILSDSISDKLRNQTITELVIEK